MGAVMVLADATSLCWGRVRRTLRFLLDTPIQCFFGAMAQQLLAAMMVMANATSPCWRRVRHTPRFLLVAATQCFFGAMAWQLLTAIMVLLEEGAKYTQVSSGGGVVSADKAHTVFVRSDGTAVACGYNGFGQCNVPVLEELVTYTQVSAGAAHTMLLRSGGTAVACGKDQYLQCRIPASEEDVFFVPNSLSAPDLVVQLLLETSAGTVQAVCRDLGGEQLASWILPDEATLVKQSIAKALMPGCRKLCVVLPDGRL